MVFYTNHSLTMVIVVKLVMQIVINMKKKLHLLHFYYNKTMVHLFNRGSGGLMESVGLVT